MYRNLSQALCSECYDRLISLYLIKAEDRSPGDRCDALAAALLETVPEEDLCEAEQIWLEEEAVAVHLASEAIRLLAAAEDMATELPTEWDIEWSLPVAGLCKAVELETVRRILVPLAEASADADLSAYRDDWDMRNIASFCANRSGPTPDLDEFSRFLLALTHRHRRGETDPIIRAFLQIADRWPGADWILTSEPDSFYQSLVVLLGDFMHPAVDIDEIEEDDYLGCQDLVLGGQDLPQGLLPKLIESTGNRPAPDRR